MYVNYYVLWKGDCFIVVSSYPSSIILGLDPTEPPHASECVWMVPGTVDPLED